MTEMFTDAEAYDVTFPEQCTSEQKVFLNSCLQIDTIYSKIIHRQNDTF